MTNNSPPFKALLNEQHTQATIEIDGKQIVITTEELENAIHWLGALRATMIPAIPIDPKNQNLPILQTDYFLCHLMQDEAAPVQAGALFVFRSPLFGWFQFPASAEFCTGLNSWLSGKSISAPPNVKLN